MRDALITALETYKNLKFYEWGAIIGFMILGVCAISDGEGNYALAMFVACVYVQLSAAYRQDNEFLINSLGDKE